MEADVSIARSGESARQHQWRDELLKTGIRGKGGQMLKFADLETLPDTTYLHAVGNLDSDERVVVSFGPEQRQVEMALREAEKIRPTPRYVVFTAFTFDPDAAKDIDEMKWPGVTLLKAQMNTDLLTEDLKKARSNNQSFWLMGQPDVEVRKVFPSPAGGEVGKDGAGGEGWEKLKKDIRAELDESLLGKFQGTVSLPFDAGENRKTAVKIVDDRGIESLKIAVLN